MNLKSNIEAKEVSRKSHITDRQRMIMVNFMEGHPAFERGDLLGPHGRAQQKELWQQLAQALNSCGDGVPRDASKWQKSWQDWKCIVKKKSRAITKFQQGTGGGSPFKPLTALEEACLRIITVEAVVGNASLPEGGSFDIAKMPLDIIDNLQNDSGEWLPISSTPPQPQPSTSKRSNVVEDESTKKRIKVSSTKVLSNYLEKEEERISLEQEKLALKREKLLLYKEEIALRREATESIVSMANEIAKYYKKKMKNLNKYK